MVNFARKQIGLIGLGALISTISFSSACMDNSELSKKIEKDFNIFASALDNRILFNDVSNPVSYLNECIPKVLAELKSNPNYSGSLNNSPIKVLNVVRPVKWGDSFSLELEIANQKRVYKY